MKAIGFINRVTLFLICMLDKKMSNRLTRKLLLKMFNSQEEGSYTVSQGISIRTLYNNYTKRKMCRRASDREFYIRAENLSWALVETVDDINLFLEILDAIPEPGFSIPNPRKLIVGNYIVYSLPNPLRIKIVYVDSEIKRTIMTIFNLKSNEQLKIMDLLIRDKKFPPLLKIINDETKSSLYY